MVGVVILSVDFAHFSKKRYNFGKNMASRLMTPYVGQIATRP